MRRERDSVRRGAERERRIYVSYLRSRRTIIPEQRRSGVECAPSTQEPLASVCAWRESDRKRRGGRKGDGTQVRSTGEKRRAFLKQRIGKGEDGGTHGGRMREKKAE
ncbi:hypothetical protein XELAEV_18026202mg [Xenopus laevis]|uniref:Uncharacterized protein n=1 Tax=Xenopus laevis TaxID=8355 RepID=A0A974CTE9_XENLA|nr:hypothetical protein XELAEV_18026202mg [Xenopus laevis]